MKSFNQYKKEYAVIWDNHKDWLLTNNPEKWPVEFRIGLFETICNDLDIKRNAKRTIILMAGYESREQKIIFREFYNIVPNKFLINLI